MGLLPQPWSQEQLLCPRQPVQAIVKKSIRPQNNVVCLVEFWRCDSLEFVPNGNVVDADLYSQQLEQVYEILKRRCPALVKWNRILLQQDNVRLHTARTTMTKIQKLGGMELLQPWSCAFRLSSVSIHGPFFSWKKFPKHWSYRCGSHRILRMSNRRLVHARS